MSSHLQHDGRRRILAPAAVVPAVVLAVVLALAGAVVLVLALRGPATAGPVTPDRTLTGTRSGGPADAPARTPAGTTGSPGPGPAALAPPAAPPPEAPAAPELGPVLPASDPVALRIPSIGVDSDVLEPLVLDADGVLPAPADYALPGWYTGGPNPGQLGPAVIAGHVDGPDGPAVFYRLGEVAVGATVDVTRADGTTATFVVDAVERYAKADFPTSRVYGNTTDRAELRLITCGGAFDRTTGHYVDNIVVFGHLVG